MARGFLPGQAARLYVYDVETDAVRLVFESDRLLFEAPNWTPDGERLVVNGDGRLFTLPSSATPGSAEPVEIDLGGIPEINNDHVLSPDGRTVYVSAEDGQLYAVPLTGGTTRRVSHDRAGLRHYLHGISADGRTLAYIGLHQDGDRRVTNVYLLPLDGGADVQLTDDGFQDDGAEFGPGPDGAEWVYFNSERAGGAPGHAQLFRMRPDGASVTQLTRDERVNWFPHPSPDGRHLVYLSYPPGTQGHPENVADVRIRLTTPEGGTGRDLLTVYGGQGALNVPSWAPDSRRFAYVQYTAPGQLAG
jgi:Tol biopolymer transport system component